MGRGGRFGKYGEQKRFERLRQKRQNPLPSKCLRKFKERKPSKIRIKIQSSKPKDQEQI